MRKEVKLQSEYKVAQRNIILSVLIGNAQMGSSIVFFKNDVVPIKLGEINACELGMGQDLIGKKLKIHTIVTDLNAQSNDMQVTYILSGGDPEEKSIAVNATVEREGEVVNFYASFQLT